MTRLLSIVLALLVGLMPEAGYAQVAAQALDLPAAGSMVALSGAFKPVALRGMSIHPEDPLKFDFILDQGDTQHAVEPQDLAALNNGDTDPAEKSKLALHAETQKLVNYFLAAMTMPRQDLWVNLSPVEKDRIVPDELIKTELGREFLAQDYLLKQLTASLIYPEDDLGKKFWAQVYAQAQEKLGTTDIPVDTFNKVWITPEKATVYEKGNTVYITSMHLKVQLESDYLAAGAIHESPLQGSTGDATVGAVQEPSAKVNVGAGSPRPENELSRQALRDVIIPVLEKEVNEGKNFAALRQAMYSLVLAQWYQDAVKDSVLNHAYAGKGKVAGIDVSDPANREKIYAQYMAAYKKGVFNYIKEESTSVAGFPRPEETIPRKYFSGGVNAAQKVAIDRAGSVDGSQAPVGSQVVKVELSPDTEFIKKISISFGLHREIPLSSVLGFLNTIQRWLERFNWREVPADVRSVKLHTTQDQDFFAKAMQDEMLKFTLKLRREALNGEQRLVFTFDADSEVGRKQEAQEAVDRVEQFKAAIIRRVRQVDRLPLAGIPSADILTNAVEGIIALGEEKETSAPGKNEIVAEDDRVRQMADFIVDAQNALAQMLEEDMKVKFRRERVPVVLDVLESWSRVAGAAGWKTVQLGVSARSEIGAEAGRLKKQLITWLAKNPVGVVDNAAQKVPINPAASIPADASEGSRQVSVRVRVGRSRKIVPKMDHQYVIRLVAGEIVKHFLGDELKMSDVDKKTFLQLVRGSSGSGVIDVYDVLFEEYLRKTENDGRGFEGMSLLLRSLPLKAGAYFDNFILRPQGERNWRSPVWRSVMANFRSGEISRLTDVKNMSGIRVAGIPISDMGNELAALGFTPQELSSVKSFLTAPSSLKVTESGIDEAMASFVVESPSGIKIDPFADTGTGSVHYRVKLTHNDREIRFVNVQISKVFDKTGKRRVKWNIKVPQVGYNWDHELMSGDAWTGNNIAYIQDPMSDKLLFTIEIPEGSRQPFFEIKKGETIKSLRFNALSSAKTAVAKAGGFAQLRLERVAAIRSTLAFMKDFKVTAVTDKQDQYVRSLKFALRKRDGKLFELSIFYNRQHRDSACYLHDDQGRKIGDLAISKDLGDLSSVKQREMLVGQLLFWFGMSEAGKLDLDGSKADVQGATNPAQRQGGIDARDMGVKRTGELIKGVVNNAALEQMITAAPGLRGIITDILPMPDFMLQLGLNIEGQPLEGTAQGASTPAAALSMGIIRDPEEALA